MSFSVGEPFLQLKMMQNLASCEAFPLKSSAQVTGAKTENLPWKCCVTCAGVALGRGKSVNAMLGELGYFPVRAFSKNSTTCFGQGLCSIPGTSSRVNSG